MTILLVGWKSFSRKQNFGPKLKVLQLPYGQKLTPWIARSSFCAKCSNTYLWVCNQIFQIFSLFKQYLLEMQHQLLLFTADHCEDTMEHCRLLLLLLQRFPVAIKTHGVISFILTVIFVLIMLMIFSPGWWKHYSVPKNTAM